MPSGWSRGTGTTTAGCWRRTWPIPVVSLFPLLLVLATLASLVASNRPRGAPSGPQGRRPSVPDHRGPAHGQRSAAAARQHHRPARRPRRLDLGSDRPGPGGLVHDAAGVEPARARAARLLPTARPRCRVPWRPRDRRGCHHAADEPLACTVTLRACSPSPATFWCPPPTSASSPEEIIPSHPPTRAAKPHNADPPG